MRGGRGRPGRPPRRKRELPLPKKGGGGTEGTVLQHAGGGWERHLGFHLSFQLCPHSAQDGDRLGYTSHFTIYDSDDSKRLMKEVMRELDISEKSLSPKAVLGRFPVPRTSWTSPEEFESGAGDDFRLKLVARAYRLYQRRLE